MDGPMRTCDSTKGDLHCILPPNHYDLHLSLGFVRWTDKEQDKKDAAEKR